MNIFWWAGVENGHPVLPLPSGSRSAWAVHVGRQARGGRLCPVTARLTQSLMPARHSPGLLKNALSWGLQHPPLPSTVRGNKYIPADVVLTAWFHFSGSFCLTRVDQRGLGGLRTRRPASRVLPCGTGTVSCSERTAARCSGEGECSRDPAGIPPGMSMSDHPVRSFCPSARPLI